MVDVRICEHCHGTVRFLFGFLLIVDYILKCNMFAELSPSVCIISTDILSTPIDDVLLFTFFITISVSSLMKFPSIHLLDSDAVITDSIHPPHSIVSCIVYAYVVFAYSSTSLFFLLVNAVCQLSGFS